MKKILLDHGINPGILKEKELSAFFEYIEAAKSGKLDEFEAFAEEFNRQLDSAKMALRKLCDTVASHAKSSIELLEGFSDDVNASLLSSFRAKDESGDSRKRINHLIIGVSELVLKHNEIQSLFLQLHKFPTPQASLELRLRAVALDCANTDRLAEKYKLTADRSAAEAEQNKETSLTLMRLADSLKSILSRLCEDCDKIVTDDHAPDSSYSRAVRGALSLIHDIERKLAEQAEHI